MMIMMMMTVIVLMMMMISNCITYKWGQISGVWIWGTEGSRNIPPLSLLEPICWSASSSPWDRASMQTQCWDEKSITTIDKLKVAVKNSNIHWRRNANIMTCNGKDMRGLDLHSLQDRSAALAIIHPPTTTRPRWTLGSSNSLSLKHSNIHASHLPITWPIRRAEFHLTRCISVHLIFTSCKTQPSIRHTWLVMMTVILMMVMVGKLGQNIIIIIIIMIRPATLRIGDGIRWVWAGSSGEPTPTIGHTVKFSRAL